MTMPRTVNAALLPLAALLATGPRIALAQSSYVAPDGKNRYPGVTIFCPNGTGTMPCNFGSGGGGGGNGSVSINLGGSAVSASNRLPVTDPSLDAAVSGGALSVAGTVGLASGSTVSVSNLPATQPVSGSVGQAGAWTVGLAGGSNAIGSVAVSNFPAMQPVSGSIAVSNLPATQPVSAAALPLPAGAATAASQSAPLGPLAPAAATATNSVVIGCQAATTLPSFSAGQQGAVPCDTSGRPYVVTVPSANNVPGYLQAVSSGGAAVYRAINAASSAMAASVKAASGMVYGYEACNSGSAAVYLRLFALGTAPTVGTSTPLVVRLLPAGVCQGYTTDVGLVFSSGIGVDVTSGSLADSDTTVLASANQVSLQVYYK